MWLVLFLDKSGQPLQTEQFDSRAAAVACAKQKGGKYRVFYGTHALRVARIIIRINALPETSRRELIELLEQIRDERDEERADDYWKS